MCRSILGQSTIYRLILGCIYDLQANWGSLYDLQVYFGFFYDAQFNFGGLSTIYRSTLGFLSTIQGIKPEKWKCFFCDSEVGLEIQLFERKKTATNLQSTKSGTGKHTFFCRSMRDITYIKKHHLPFQDALFSLSKQNMRLPGLPPRCQKIKHCSKLQPMNT